MLANGAKLGYKKSGGSIFTDLPGFKEISEVGIEPEKAENICLTDRSRQYENGTGGAGGITYELRYDGSKADCPYCVVRIAQDAEEVLSLQETLIDGTTAEFDGQVSVKRAGGGVNGVIEFSLAISS